MTPFQYKVWLNHLPETIMRAMRAADKETMAEAEELARDYSSGPFSQGDLRRMGHPYAVRDPRPPMDAAIINRQKGLFQEAWRGTQWARGSTIMNRIENRSKVSQWLDKGTRKMIRRPIRERIDAQIAQSREARQKAALNKVMTPGG